MNHLPYARGAYAIAEARSNGMRPEGPVIVVLHGEEPYCSNAIVYADPKDSYRWDWVLGLNVVVLMGKETRLGTILNDIETCSPTQLDVIDTDRGIGWMVLFTKPKLKTLTLPKFMVMDWLGDGEWHKALNETKASYGLVTT